MSFKLVVIIYFGFCTQITLLDCPRLCECKWKSGKESVICLSANLSTVPRKLDTGTQVLDLTGNNLVIIRHDEFSNLGLLNLQKVYISKCRLKSLERYSFRNLINLMELDLSYNALVHVPSHTFDSIPELRELKLSGNPIQRIGNDAFINLPQLIKLEISDSRLDTIEMRAFYGLENSLEQLRLDKNSLVNVVDTSLTILRNLHGLELAGNPWNCSCFLRPLREWMLRQNVPFGIPPSCEYPKRLKMKAWDKLELNEFACIPEILAVNSLTNGMDGENVTMSCQVKSIPEPHLQWFFKNKLIANLSGSSYTLGQKLYIVLHQNNLSVLSIFNANLLDAGTYTCVAENKAGKAEANVTLVVSKKTLSTVFNNNFLIASIITGLSFVLISCFLGVYACFIQKKQSLKWKKQDFHRQDNYEKIEMNNETLVNSNGEVQKDILLVTVQKNGDYRVVPEGDTDQEPEEDEEHVNNIFCTENLRQWVSTSSRDTLCDNRWNSPKDYFVPGNLHKPRNINQKAGIEVTKSFNGAKNAFNKKISIIANVSSTTTSKVGAASAINKNVPDYLFRNVLGHGITRSNYATTCNRKLSASRDDNMFPDLIDNSSKNTSLCSIEQTRSEGGSVRDINELFCTLPRIKSSCNSQYRCSESQSPLLIDNRYGSNGGEISTYERQQNSDRRLSDDLNPLSRNHNKSNSILNLSQEENRESLKFTDLNSTPLLDVSHLEHRILLKRSCDLVPGFSSSTNVSFNQANGNYHAAQLERFLEEYRSLQNQLTKIKKTCEDLTEEKRLYLSKPVNSIETDEAREVNTSDENYKLVNISISPNPNQSLQDSVDFKNFENELTKYLLSQSLLH